eukprot:TRINITY_DN1021_c0_g1_i1.p1 TRINITY_DN1021_c0_g1~~TRINITY_DN1021_c0_g1_i1.p1  ORF type:complete len:265 (+),score=113.40 TRINITY_DN1021_c0_g1_i1:40-795(+)
MSSVGSGYDLSAATLSPEGRIFQVEYAAKAVEASGTAIGVQVAGGVVLGVEKIVRSPLLEYGSNKRIFKIAPHVGVATVGLLADSRQIVNHSRSEAAKYKQTYNSPIPGHLFAERVSSYVHRYTMSGARPFGVSSIIATYDKAGPHLYMVEPSGVSFGYRGACAGKGKQAAKAEIEKLKFAQLSPQEAVKEVAKIIYAVHDEIKDKYFELELSWICADSGFKHEFVPQSLYDEAVEYAKAAIAEDRGFMDD